MSTVLTDALAFSGPLSDALRAARDDAVLCDLSPTGVLRIAGEDAAAFLHAQLTSDVLALAVGSTQHTAWCSAKGRVLANGVLWRRGDQEFFWLLPAALTATVQKRLSMFKLRARVGVDEATRACVRFGVGGPRAGVLIGDAFGPAGSVESRARDGAYALALPGERYLLLLEPDQNAAAWLAALAANARTGPFAAWEWLSIQAGVASITPATQDEFVPQMLNWELQGGVSFSKGCYPGQEIVARTQYRGKLKERLYRVHIASTAAPAAGDPLYSPVFGDQACGTLVNVAPAPEGGHDALAVIQTLAAADVHWRASDGPALAIQPLPYAVPGA